MNRVSKTPHYRDPSTQRALEKECCYPTCYSPVSQKVEKPLCDKHLISIYRSVESLFKEVDRSRDDVISLSQLRRRNPYAPVGVVYFVRFGERVKIGFSTNLKKRLINLPIDELLGTMPGSRHTESMMHKQFKHLHVTGEWFSMGEDLLEFIASLEKVSV